MIAELAVMSIGKSELPLFYAILPLIILIAIQLGFAYLSLKSEKVRKSFALKQFSRNKESIVHENVKQRDNYDQLITQLREKQTVNTADIEFAIKESFGKLTVNSKQNGEQVPLPLPLIIDGKIQHGNIQILQKTELWVRQQLRKLGFRDIKTIAYCVQYEDESFFIDLKEEK